MPRIDFVADINCPWCTLGFIALDSALVRLGQNPVQLVEIQPFELNPQLGADGVNLVEYLSKRQGMGFAQIEDTHQRLRQLGEGLGFHFAERERLWNSFDSQRLLHWAAVECPAGSQYALYRALIQAYQGQARNTSDHVVLVELVKSIGLDSDRAAEVLAGDEFAHEVRQRQQQWQQAGINAVPSTVINHQQLLQGAQPVAVFEKALQDLLHA